VDERALHGYPLTRAPQPRSIAPGAATSGAVAMHNTRRLLLAGLLTALIFAAGQALAEVPNVEVVTFLTFIAGYLLGPLAGALVGGFGMGAHSLFNVMGAAAPPLLAAQMVCYGVVGLAGAPGGRALVRIRSRALSAVVAGAMGAALVVVYQVTVNAVSFVTFAPGVSVWTYVWGGVAFGMVQVAWNAALFGVAAPPTLRILESRRRP
jgi:hypothetical protein